MYLLRNCKVVTEDAVLEGYGLILENGLIKSIEKEEKLLEEIEREVAIKKIDIVDGEGAFVTAGFIDVHSDYIENIVAPRPTSLISFELGLKEAERVFLSTGITTIYHSLAIYDDEVECKAVRKGENIEKLIGVIDNYKNMSSLINHRVHARFEINCLGELEKLRDLVNEGKVDLLSLMDHSPGQGQYRNLEIYKNIIKEYKSCGEDEAREIIRRAQDREKLTIEAMKELIDICIENSVVVASHDDDSISKINLVKDLGVAISEFPITLEAAIYAKNKGLGTIGGSPNIILGGSHSGNLSMEKGILNNAIDCLCSDYYPQSMLHAPFILNEKYNIPLNDALKLVTLNPAKLLNIDKEYGSLKEGKRADILFIKKEGVLPEISKVFVNGELRLVIN